MWVLVWRSDLMLRLVRGEVVRKPSSCCALFQFFDCSMFHCLIVMLLYCCIVVSSDLIGHFQVAVNCWIRAKSRWSHSQVQALWTAAKYEVPVQAHVLLAISPNVSKTIAISESIFCLLLSNCQSPVLMMLPPCCAIRGNLPRIFGVESNGLGYVDLKRIMSRGGVFIMSSQGFPSDFG